MEKNWGDTPSATLNEIKRIAFENAYESFIIFQPLLYVNVPAESPSYAPTFFQFFLFDVKSLALCAIGLRC